MKKNFSKMISKLDEVRAYKAGWLTFYSSDLLKRNLTASKEFIAKQNDI
jgi:hypothetical protein